MNIVKLPPLCPPSEIDNLLSGIESMDLRSIVAGVIWYDNYSEILFENRIPYFDKYLHHILKDDNIGDQDIVAALMKAGYSEDISWKRLNKRDTFVESKPDTTEHQYDSHQYDFNQYDFFNEGTSLA